MKILSIARYAEWWEYKLPPLLSIGYATLLLNQENIFSNGRSILLILLSLIIGAVYVSITNDITDIKDDLAAGKVNRMANKSTLTKLALPVLCIFIGFLFLAFLYRPDHLSCIFYIIPWMSFSLYSFKPIRLKNKGIYGVFADASGSHIFTSLLMISFLCFATNNTINFLWMGLVAIWATCYGIRGILWHQFHDRDNDLKSSVITFATLRNPNQFRFTERAILGVELLATIGILLMLNNAIVYAAAFIYMLLVFFRYKKLHLFPIIIIESRKQYQIVMLDFMQVLFPVSLLIFAAFTQTNGWIILTIHLLLFPFKTIGIFKDLRNIVLH